MCAKNHVAYAILPNTLDPLWDCDTDVREYSSVSLADPVFCDHLGPCLCCPSRCSRRLLCMGATTCRPSTTRTQSGRLAQVGDITHHTALTPGGVMCI